MNSSRRGALNPQQSRFIEEYVVELNATQATIRAGYSRATARQMGAENLSKPVIHDEGTRHINQRSIDLEGTVDEIIAQAHRLRVADMASILDQRGVPLPIEKMPIEFRQGLLKSLEIRETINEDQSVVRIYSIGFADRLKILRMIGDRLGAWSKQPKRGGSTAERPRIDKASSERGRFQSMARECAASREALCV